MTLRPIILILAVAAVWGGCLTVLLCDREPELRYATQSMHPESNLGFVLTKYADGSSALLFVNSDGSWIKSSSVNGIIIAGTTFDKKGISITVKGVKP